MNRELAGVVAAMAMAGGAMAQDAVQWRVQDGGNGHWYGISAPLALSWSTWNSAATAQGAHLLTLTSGAEQNFIMAAFTGSMLGLRAAPGSSSFVWCTGEPLAFTSWGSNACASGPYPNNSQGVERFVAIRADSCGIVWDDFQASELGSPIQVTFEWEADCNSDGLVDFGQIRDGSLADANANNIPDCCEQGVVCGCPADIVQDNAVNGVDLAAVINAWGTDGGKLPRSDVDGNGIVDGADLAQVLGSWGPCP